MQTSKFCGGGTLPLARGAAWRAMRPWGFASLLAETEKLESAVYWYCSINHYALPGHARDALPPSPERRYSQSLQHARKGTHKHTWAQQEQRCSMCWQLGFPSPASYPCPQIGQSWHWQGRLIECLSQGCGKYCSSMANS